MQLFKIPDSLKFHPPFDNRMSFTKEMQIKAKCFKKWCVLLLGKKVTITINYNPLEILSNYTQHHKKHISTAALTVVYEWEGITSETKVKMTKQICFFT